MTIKVSAVSFMGKVRFSTILNYSISTKPASYRRRALIKRVGVLFYEGKKGLFYSRSVMDKGCREIVDLRMINTALMVSGEVGV